MINTTPSMSGTVDSPEHTPVRMPGAEPERKDCCNVCVRANARVRTALGGPACPTKVPGEGTNPYNQSSFATKNVFHALQDLSQGMGGSPSLQLEAADWLSEPITSDLHQSLIELLERPDILSLHAVRRVGREQQLHLKVHVLGGSSCMV